MDWEGCDLVEVVPGKVAGKPVIRGTRILADTIVEDAALGAPVAKIHESFPHRCRRAQSENCSPSPIASNLSREVGGERCA